MERRQTDSRNTARRCEALQLVARRMSPRSSSRFWPLLVDFDTNSIRQKSVSRNEKLPHCDKTYVYFVQGEPNFLSEILLCVRRWFRILLKLCFQDVGLLRRQSWPT